MSFVDDGGVDIINANDINNGIFLNLAPGSWSNISGTNPYLLAVGDDNEGEQIASSFSDTYPHSISSDTDILNVGQVYIESQTYIENCNLTDYGDIIFDNSTNNVIYCGGGDDKVSISLGNDQVYGGSGTDEVSIYGTVNDYTVEQTNSGYTLTNINNGALNFGQDIFLQDIENISFYGDSDTTTYYSDIASYYSNFSYSNSPPDIDAFPSSSTVIAGNSFQYQFTASDPDSDPITFSYSGDFPNWLTLTNNGLLSGTSKCS